MPRGEGLELPPGGLGGLAGARQAGRVVDLHGGYLRRDEGGGAPDLVEARFNLLGDIRRRSVDGPVELARQGMPRARDKVTLTVELFATAM